MSDWTSMVNLTPHAVRLIGEAMSVELPPAGPVPRVVLTRAETVGVITLEGLQIPVVETASGESVTGLPPERPGVLLIVARVVAEACPQRRDLAFPHEAVRDADGRIIGCRALGQVAAPGRA